MLAMSCKMITVSTTISHNRSTNLAIGSKNAFYCQITVY